LRAPSGPGGRWAVASIRAYRADAGTRRAEEAGEQLFERRFDRPIAMKAFRSLVASFAPDVKA
jgi:hypothetical protein